MVLLSTRQKVRTRSVVRLLSNGLLAANAHAGHSGAPWTDGLLDRAPAAEEHRAHVAARGGDQRLRRALLRGRVVGVHCEEVPDLVLRREVLALPDGVATALTA